MAGSRHPVGFLRQPKRRAGQRLKAQLFEMPPERQPEYREACVVVRLRESSH